MHSFYFVINVGKKLRIEPSLAAAFQKNEKRYSPGISILVKKPYSKFNILFGLRHNIVFHQTTSSFSYSSPGGRIHDTRTDKLFEFSPVVGGEYKFIEHFSIGAEVK